MSGSSFLFYGLALGLVAFTILSSTLPKLKAALVCLGLALCFGIGLLYFIKVSLVNLVLFISMLVLLFIVLIVRTGSPQESQIENSKLGLLTWIILGSFLLILATVLKDTKWHLLSWEDQPSWLDIFSQYGILTFFIGTSLISALLWLKGNQND